MKAYIIMGWLLLITFAFDIQLTLKNMSKLDLTKEFKQYYTAALVPEVVTIEKGLFVTVTGKGDPNGPLFAEVTAALYAVAYGIKFSSKQKGRDFTVSKLEGFWWVNGDYADPRQAPRDQWNYELAIRMPDYITRQQFSEAVLAAEKKKKSVFIRQVDLKHIEEGLSVQLMHIGPYSEEPASLKKMDDFMQQHGLRMNGRHHEIYLSDFRKTAPEKLKTILRHPVSK
ncbi:GyrI-like domain-containing protein [Chitinophaga ginsengisegetis]|uniref:GyrI-like domain-containing protein n=1 Tax=Chitinophaga ginsengisegetis TaxID=393003 RepID=UPI0034426B7B